MRCDRRQGRGFTLIELMVAMVVLGILMAIALPSYNSYVKRSKVPAGLDALSAYSTRMEQRYQDNGSYAAAGACGVALPTVDNFGVTCTISAGGQGFTATATGSGPLAGYAYTINNNGVRVTTAHPKGVPATNCWSTKGNVCDT
jgi:type IV pilus assembly protein PilE